MLGSLSQQTVGSVFFSHTWATAGAVFGPVNDRLGFQFTISEDIEINYLSLFTQASIINENIIIHRVSDGATIASATISGTADTWVPSAISPVTLLSSATYTCSTRASGSSRNVYRNPTGLTFDARITKTANVFGGSDALPTSTTANVYVFCGFGWTN